MAIDPPYRFDPWQNLVNVHWRAPLEEIHYYAVFTYIPSYLDEDGKVHTGWVLIKLLDSSDTSDMTWEAEFRETHNSSNHWYQCAPIGYNPAITPPHWTPSLFPSLAICLAMSDDWLLESGYLNTFWWQHFTAEQRISLPSEDQYFTNAYCIAQYIPSTGDIPDPDLTA